jgi:5-hydroxyisourate hydrolase-like protein (transthyretin family)
VLVALSVLLFGLPFVADAAEAPGGMTVLVKDQTTGRPVPNAQITVTKRETGSSQAAETDERGRVVIEQHHCNLLLQQCRYRP